MYYNNSSFPIFLFKLNFEGNNIENIISNVLFIIEQESFEIDFSNNVVEKTQQDLFSYLCTVIPPLILSDKKFLKDIYFENVSIKNHILFEQLSEIRLDIKKINSTISKMEDDPLCLNIDKTTLVRDLIVFVFQYVFIELSKNIVATNVNGKDYFFDIKSGSKKVEKYSRAGSSTLDRAASQNNFIKSYLLSFGDLEDETIKLIESELIFMTRTINQKKRLNCIFENNIKLAKGISRKDKYQINKFLFKNFTAKFFFPQLKSNSTEDIEIEDTYFNFIKSISR
jgi:hypothetical protein